MKEDLLQARNPNTEEARLLDLAKSPDEEVRRAVALNLSAPPEALLALAKDPSAKVRIAVAYNPRTPKEALEELAKDRDRQVRMGVALNPNTPIEALLGLTEDFPYRHWIGKVARRQLLLRLSELPPPKEAASIWLSIWQALPKEDRVQIEAFEGGDQIALLGRLGE